MNLYSLQASPRSQWLTPPHTGGAPLTAPSAPAAPQRVNISDTDTLAALRLSGTPHLVVCEWPAQRQHLGQGGATIPNLHLALSDGVAAGEVRAAIGMARKCCPDLGHLSLSCGGGGAAARDVLDQACSLLSQWEEAPLRVSLCFDGPSSGDRFIGMRSLLRCCDGIGLNCHGPLVTAAAVEALTACAPHEVRIDSLTLSGLGPDRALLIDQLARVHQPLLHIDIALDDSDDPERFIDELLAAGASPRLQLSVHTPDGRRAEFQDALGAHRERHEPALLARFVNQPSVNPAELLAHCLALPVAGAQIFAWACEYAGLALGKAPLEIPIKHRACLRALSHAHVAHTALCQLPGDAGALQDCDKRLLQSLRLDFGDMAMAHAAMPVVAATLLQMRELRSCHFHHAQASVGLGPWLCAQLVNAPVQTAEFDFEGPMAEAAFAEVARFLSKPTLSSLVCRGALAASWFMRHLALFGAPVRATVTLHLPPEAETALIACLVDLRKAQLHLIVHWREDGPPQRLLAALAQALQAQAPGFLVAWLDLSSPHYEMPPDHPVLQLLARQHIRAALQQAEAPQEVDGPATLKSFVSSIGEGLSASGGSTVNPKRIQAAAPHLLHPFEKLLPDYLGESGLLSLSSANKTMRAHIGGLEQRLHGAVNAWLSERLQQGLPLAHAEALLLALLGSIATRQVLAPHRQAAERALRPPPGWASGWEVDEQPVQGGTEPAAAHSSSAEPPGGW